MLRTAKLLNSKEKWKHIFSILKVLFSASNISYSDKCWMKKYLQYAENMFPLFFDIYIYAFFIL